MQLRSRRSWATALALLAGCGYLTVGFTCTSFTGESLLRATDFCFIFDCQGGILGGTIDPCAGLGSGNQTFESLVGTPTEGPILPVFNDCPVGP